MRDIQVWYRNLIIILASSFLIVNIVMSKFFLVYPNSNNKKGDAKTQSIPFSGPIIQMKARHLVMLQNSSYEQRLGYYEIPSSKIDVGPQLGSGTFGQIFIAVAHDLFKPGSKTIVAVKFLSTKYCLPKRISQRIYEEMELMEMIGKHKNIINFLGYCPEDMTSFLVLECAPYGNLRDFLRSESFNYDESNPSIRISLDKQLVSCSYQIAQGLEHIESQGFLHRDLAARNILVAENYIMKIADFGKGQKIHEIHYISSPEKVTSNIRLAPEVIMYQKYDTRSEVWAFGVLLWEIMSLGVAPRTKMTQQQLLVFQQNGNRWSKPEQCSMEIYKLMLECWHFRPELRPSFSKIVNVLHQILSRMPDIKK